MSYIVYRDYKTFFIPFITTTQSEIAQGDIILLEDSQPHCLTLMHSLMNADVTVRDVATGNNYAMSLQDMIGIASNDPVQANRILLTSIDLTAFVLAYSRQLMSLGVAYPNELINNAENLNLKVYPTAERSGNFTVETDNPNILQEVCSLKNITTDGQINNIQMLNDANQPYWKVGYAIINATTTCMRTELRSVSHSSFTYEFISDVASVISFVLSQQFTPDWY